MNRRAQSSWSAAAGGTGLQGRTVAGVAISWAAAARAMFPICSTSLDLKMPPPQRNSIWPSRSPTSGKSAAAAAGTSAPTRSRRVFRSSSSESR
jgi:hypothetical protein